MNEKWPRKNGITTHNLSHVNYSTRQTFKGFSLARADGGIGATGASDAVERHWHDRGHPRRTDDVALTSGISIRNQN